MINIEAVADALKTKAAAVSGVREAFIGVNTVIPSTPAVEVQMTGFDLSDQSASAGVVETILRFECVVYVPMREVLETDERELLPIVKGLVESINTQPRTLGGLVEDVKATGGQFGEIIMGAQGEAYRYCSILVEAGHLP